MTATLCSRVARGPNHEIVDLAHGVLLMNESTEAWTYLNTFTNTVLPEFDSGQQIDVCLHVCLHVYACACLLDAALHGRLATKTRDQHGA